MDNYINENSELKKRLDELATNNKSLLSQLHALKASLESQQQQSHASSILTSTTTATETATTLSHTNQFGTLLLVLVLFFAVVLGVWSPVFTKDAMSRHLPAAGTLAVSASSHVQRRAPTNTVSSSAAAVSAVCAAVAMSAVSGGAKADNSLNSDNGPLDEDSSLIFAESGGYLAKGSFKSDVRDTSEPMSSEAGKFYSVLEF